MNAEPRTRLAIITSGSSTLTGALVGTLAGYDKLPKTWRDGVEAADALWNAGKHL